MSNKTTSPNSFKAARWANVPPIWPAPINAIFALAIIKLSVWFETREFASANARAEQEGFVCYRRVKWQNIWARLCV
jgi:hypothetical protein